MTFDYRDDRCESVRFTDVDGDQLHLEPAVRHGKPAISLRTARGDGRGGGAVHVLAEETEELVTGIRRITRASVNENPHTFLGEVRFARRFVAQRPGQPDIHGVEYPSGHVIADVPYTGLTAFLTISVITDEYENTVIHWADEPTRSSS
ncbi:hypothetical protein [Streptomyces cylindrosporus]|uniref:Uncharacterized protein n=1 Tax=Streptomyces cylindrosporus TaxID=2927583 RepID=A0ABS9YL02_9ACTN|nr:hypothetical protein [Streptomyces cylindrosporus]MCI3277589.1 hypothetical protein [Streptomyces cylindrosporus]